MRPPRNDVRDHVDSLKSGHKLSYPFYGAVQPQSYLEVRVRENFEAARFSNFSTVSTNSGRSITHKLFYETLSERLTRAHPDESTLLHG